MAFNITSWGKKGRNFGRGSSPPRGSIEWIAVGDMWQAAPPARPSRSGFSVGSATLYEIGFTELDAADRWICAIDRSINQARRLHGDKILSKTDASAWTEFMTRWLPFKGDMQLPGHFNAMLSSNKKQFDSLMNESKKLHDRFVAKGLAMSPVPYMGELVELLRSMPKKLTAGQMVAKLAAGVKCGEKMLDENTSWFYWMISNDTSGLKTAIRDARTLADAYSPSRNSPATYGAGDPAYDEFLRRLTKIWIEAAGLYGMTEVRRSAAAEAADVARDRAEQFTKPSNYLWLLATAGIAYLGIAWLAGRGSRKIAVGVPDAYPHE
jgi:phage FluMu protein gp41